MKIREILEQDQFASIKSEVDLFSERMLEKYIADIRNNQQFPREKEIFDVVWGPVEFNSGEILILDSPLIQRLRKIKQLGLASYVYCGADYSRLSHTIGVFHLAGKMAEQISKKMKGVQEDYNFAQIVRLAALFHDAGHMYYSHVSEHYFAENENYSRVQDVKKALNYFRVCANVDISLHELIAVILVNSNSVRDLINIAVQHLELPTVRTATKLDEVIEFMSCLIIGQANGEALLPYYQIVNGPVDADKCDYLFRDSHATNVPVAVDIFRLIHKLELTKGQLPNSSKVSSKIWDGPSNHEVYYPTIKSSALEALNQLVMARSIMYNSVYYHQKVRTAETMFRKVLESLDALRSPAVNDFTTILQISDDVFGYYCYAVLCEMGDTDKEKLKGVTDQLNQINFRFFMKRACSIDINSWYAYDEKSEYSFKTDIQKLFQNDRIQELEASTKREYSRLCEILQRPDNCERDFMFVEFPKSVLSDSIPDAMIQYSSGEVRRAADIFQAGTWIGSKDSRNVEQYMVTNCLHRDLAFLALQKVLFSKYNIILNINAAIYAKVRFEDIEKEQLSLFEKNYYKDQLLLVSDLLLNRFSTDISRLSEKYQTFEGANGRIITKDVIRHFLRQFLRTSLSSEQVFSLIEGVISLLNEAVYINRQMFSTGIVSVFKKLLKSQDRIHVCPLGGLKDSAFHFSYYFNDFESFDDHILLHKSLQDALENSVEGESIVFFDDGAYSGVQVSSILEEYMGVSLEERSAQEHHVDPLNKQECSSLKKRKISLAYICFNSSNKSLIEEKAQKVGIRIESIVYLHDMNKKVFEPDVNIFADNEQRKLVQETLFNIGRELLESTKIIEGKYKENWSLERVQNSALGYNDAQQMVILKSSVPTYTLTAFWLENGVYKEAPWIPLFPRTSK